MAFTDSDCSFVEDVEQLGQDLRFARTEQAVGVDHHRIARKDGDIVVPTGMYGRLTAPQIGAIHDVVVEQRKVVEHLDGQCGRFGLFDPFGKEVACHQQRYRTDPFPSLFERVGDRFVQQMGLLGVFQVFDFVLNDVG